MLSTSVCPTTQRALAVRAPSVARRLLAGAGTASYVAYRRDPDTTLDILAHGVTRAGEFVVARIDAGSHDEMACGPSEPDGAGADSGAEPGLAVRLDIRREAAEAQVRILAATAHLLGRVEWLDEVARAERIGTPGLPESVAEVAAAPGGMLGIVRAERVLLHDGAGVTPLAFADLVVELPHATIYPRTHEELDAQDLVAVTPPEDLVAWCAAVLEGRLPGRVLSERPAAPECGATVGRVYCADIDAVGMSLVHVGAQRRTVVFVAFTEPVRDAGQLRARLDALRAAALS